MIRQDTRLLAVLLVLLAFLVTWLVLAGRAHPREYPRRTVVEEEPPPLPIPPKEPEPERRSLLVSRWLRDLLADAGIPVVRDTDEEEGPDRGCILHGKLIWENKPWLPLRGVEIRVTDAWLDTITTTEKRASSDPVLLPPRATTDEWGKFVLRNVPTRKTLFLLARDDNRTLMVKKLRQLPLPGQMLNLYEVKIPEQGTLKGRVVDSAGKAQQALKVRAVSDPLNRGPLHDERIEARRIERARFFRASGRSGPSTVPRWVTRRDQLLPFPSTMTMPDGSFVLRGARAGRTVLVVHGRHGAALRRVEVTANKTTDIGTVVAVEGKALRGYVADEEGRPLWSGQVSVQPDDWPFTMEPVTTDSHGYFDCGYIPGNKHSLFVKTRDNQLWRAAWPTQQPDLYPWAREGTVYEFAAGHSGLVVVVDPAGRPVAEAEASLSHLDSGFTETWLSLPRHVAATESPGRFVIHGLPEGQTLRLVIAAPAHAPGVLGFTVRRGKGPFQAGGLRIQLRPIFPVRFQVRGPDNQPVARASVSVRFQAPPPDAPPGIHDHLLSRGGAVLGHTDENGVLETPALWRSAAWFAAWHPDFGLTPTQLTYPLPGKVVPIRLRPIGRIAGELTFEHERPGARWIIRAQPAEYFSSTYEQNPFFSTHRTVTAPDGSFYFNDLFAGRWVLSLHRLAQDPGRTWAFAWPEDQHDEVDVLAGMTVLHQWDIPRDRAAWFHITGTAQMDGQPLAHAVVRLHEALDTSSVQSVLEATAKAIDRAKATGDKRLQRERLRQLRLLHREMRSTWRMPPLERFPEDVFMVSSHPATAVRADAEGRFDFAVRRAGLFEVRLANPQGKHELARATATLDWGRDKRRAEVHFKVRTGSLRLTLTTHETLRIRQRTVRLSQEPAGTVLSLRTDEQGDLFAPRVPAGRYRLTVEGRGVDEAPVRNPIVEITAGTLNVHHAYTDPYVREPEAVR